MFAGMEGLLGADNGPEADSSLDCQHKDPVFHLFLTPESYTGVLCHRCLIHLSVVSAASRSRSVALGTCDLELLPSMHRV